MVIKLHRSVGVHACLRYVIGKMDIEGNKIIMAENISPSENPIAAIREEFRKRDIANIRTERVSFHASINPTPDELEKMDIQEICKEYMSRLGYADQPYIVVEHNDTGRKHYHIVSHRIGPDGRKINSSNEIIKTNRYVKELNKKFRQSIQKDNSSPKIDAFDPDKGSMKKQILNIWSYACTYKYSNNYELAAVLQSYSVELINKEKCTYAAGIQNGKRLTRAIAVDKTLIQPVVKKSIPPMEQERLKNLVKYAMKVSLTEEHARNILARKEIGLVTLKNDQGRIYGVYIIDHKYKMVLKASDISHEIAANQWEILQNNKWDKLKLAANPKGKDYYISYVPIVDLTYNYWENTNLSYRDLKYSRKREMGRRM